MATMQDPNKHVYPIAFGVVDSENDASWSFFFRHLKFIVEDTPEVVFVSDRHSSIEKGLRNTYVFATQGICTFHLWMNIKAKYKRSDLRELFFRAAKAYSIPEFNEVFGHIASVASNVADYLKQASFKLWARSHFAANRFNITTTNNAETMNSVLKDARKSPLIALFDVILEDMASWYHKHREEAAKCRSTVTDYVNDEMAIRWEASLSLLVRPLSQYEFQVGSGAAATVVNLHTRSCECKKFDIDRFPCSHAIAAAKERGVDPLSLVDSVYRTEVWRAIYDEAVYPVPPISRWAVPATVSQTKCLPPIVKTRVGRPKSKRIPSRGEWKWFANKSAQNASSRGGVGNENNAPST